MTPSMVLKGQDSTYLQFRTTRIPVIVKPSSLPSRWCTSCANLSSLAHLFSFLYDTVMCPQPAFAMCLDSNKLDKMGCFDDPA